MTIHRKLKSTLGCFCAIPLVAFTPSFSFAEIVTIEQVIREHRQEPVSKSIVPVATSLAKHTLYVATEPSTEPNRLRLKTGLDKQGKVWVYVYTSESELSKAFPSGTGYASMEFSELFKIIEPATQFRGIYINSASNSFYPIPRELFESIKKLGIIK